MSESIEIMKVKRMVVAYTVKTEGITYACDGKVWRVDVDLVCYYKGLLQILEITPEKIQRLSGI